MHPRNEMIEYCTSCSSYQPGEEPLTEERRAELEQRIALLTDIIELKEGKTPQELHPEMNDEQLSAHMLGLAYFSQSL